MINMIKIMRLIAFLLLWVVCISALIDVTFDHSISGYGFHPSVNANITIYGNLSSCFLAVEEKFSHNFFLQEHELDQLRRYNVGTKLSSPICTEATAAEALPFSLYLYLNNNEPVTTSNEFGTRFFYCLKTHIRYLYPKVGGGLHYFKKNPAVLWARCPASGELSPISTKFACNANTKEVCEWSAIPISRMSTLPTLSIPQGNSDLYQKIFLTTQLAAFAGMFIILYSLSSLPIY